MPSSVEVYTGIARGFSTRHRLLLDGLITFLRDFTRRKVDFQRDVSHR